MRRTAPPSIVRALLVLFVLLDLLLLLSFILNQWLGANIAQAFGLAALLSLPLALLMLPLVNGVVASPGNASNVPLTGENIPGAGQ